MKRNVILGVSAVALSVCSVVAVKATESKRAVPKAYIQGSFQCVSVTVSGNLFTATGTNTAQIRNAAGTQLPIYTSKASATTCSGAAIKLNLN